MKPYSPSLWCLASPLLFVVVNLAVALMPGPYKRARKPSKKASAEEAAKQQSLQQVTSMQQVTSKQQARLDPNLQGIAGAAVALGACVPRKRRSGTMLRPDSVPSTPSASRVSSVSRTPSLKLRVGPPPTPSLKLNGPKPSQSSDTQMPPPPPSSGPRGFQPTFSQAMNLKTILDMEPPTPTKSQLEPSSQWLRRRVERLDRGGGEVGNTQDSVPYPRRDDRRESDNELFVGFGREPEGAYRGDRGDRGATQAPKDRSISVVDILSSDDGLESDKDLDVSQNTQEILTHIDRAKTSAARRAPALVPQKAVSKASSQATVAEDVIIAPVTYKAGAGAGA